MARSLVPSVPWKSSEALLVFLIPWIVLPLAAVFSLQVLAPASPLADGFLRGLNQDTPQAAFWLVLIDVVGSGGLMAYYLRKYRVGLGALGLRPFSLGRALLALIIIFVGFSVLIALVYAVVVMLFPHFNPDQPQVNQFTQSHDPNTRMYSLLALVIIPPLVEEPVFRGFMFPAFAKRFGGVGGAVFSSLLFGFAHLQANVIVYTFVLGLLLCWMYRRLGSIIPGMALHMVNNYIAFTALGTG